MNNIIMDNINNETNSNYLRDEISSYILLFFTLSWIFSIVICIMRGNICKLCSNRVKRKQIKKYTTTETIDDVCSICLENLENNIIKLDCNHIYHIRCINMWIIYNNNIECPLCRTEIIL